jgi:glycosyltransferase involved in cell wall biosynthesis
MKVLIVASWFPTAESPFSGIFIAEQARALAAEHEVTVVAPEVLAAGADASRNLETAEGYTVIRIGLPARSLVHHFDYARAVVGEIRSSRCDIVHAHVTLPAGFAAVLAGRWTRRPVVITEHRGPFSALMETPRDRFKVRFALKHADAVIAVSRALAGEMTAQGVGRHIEIVPNLVDVLRFRFSPATRRPGEPYRLLFAGILRDHNKNLPVLLHALAKLSVNSDAHRLTIIGDGELRKECEQLASELGIAAKCRFRGAVSPDELAGEMANCDLFVLPSRVETFGIVAAEAMAVGRPVVATRCGGPEDILTPKTGLLVPVDDPVALADAIARVCGNLDAYRPEEISEYAGRRFGHAAVTARLAEIYHGVMRPRTQARRAAVVL